MNAVVDSVHSMLGFVVGAGPAPLHEPFLHAADRDNVAAVVQGGFVSSIGIAIADFETELATFTGAKHAVALVNGTAALHLALHCTGVEPGDEVLVPALTFAATAHAVLMAHAEPHFVDSCPNTLGIDVAALRDYLHQKAKIKDGNCYNRDTGRRIKAIMPVHIFGHIGDIEGLLELASDYHLDVIEDAAEALGSSKNGIHAGLFGKAGAISFNGNKIITTGGGGAVVTNDDALARRLRHVATTAKHTHPYRYFHDETGFNYRMPALNAALGNSQLEQLPRFLEIKKDLAERYRDACQNADGFSFLNAPEGSNSNNWLNAIWLSNGSLELRDHILEQVNALGYGCRPIWDLLTGLPHLKRYQSMSLFNAPRIAQSVINVPSGVAVMIGFQGE